MWILKKLKLLCILCFYKVIYREILNWNRTNLRVPAAARGFDAEGAVEENTGLREVRKYIKL